MPKPIKRHKSLQPVSREHHHGLLLTWKIREGLKKEVGVDRIVDYVRWFWKTYLDAHFEFEEKHLFPILGNDDELIKRALQEHELLKGLCNAKDLGTEKLNQLEQSLTEHIRFEERVVFTEIQKRASEATLAEVEEAHEKVSADDWPDEFWLK